MSVVVASSTEAFSDCCVSSAAFVVAAETVSFDIDGISGDFSSNFCSSDCGAAAADKRTVNKKNILSLAC